MTAVDPSSVNGWDTSTRGQPTEWRHIAVALVALVAAEQGESDV